MSNTSADNSRSSPIGIFDSGIGGLSIWQSIVALLPNESTVYIGDQVHLPYGTKTKAQIRMRAVVMIRFLLKHGAKLIVVGCNTATVAGIEYYRTLFRDVPIIGVVPVVKTAAENSRTKHFIVLSTSFTAGSLYQKYLIDTFAGECVVYNIASSGIVEYVENGNLKTGKIRTELIKVLAPFIPDHVDVIVLGCTHYSFLKDVIVDIVGKKVAILDSGPAVARHVSRIIEHNMLQSFTKKPLYEFFTTGEASNFEKVSMKLLGKTIYVKHTNI